MKKTLSLRWQSSALLALQEAAEAYMVHMFEDAWVDPVHGLECFRVLTRYVGTYVRSMRNE